MSRSAIELDFFGMEKELSPPPKLPTFARRRSFRDIQGVISKINPEVLKTVIANGSSGLNKSVTVPCTPKEDHTIFPPLPVHGSNLRQSCEPKRSAETAPMTIFYNGMVAVFDVSPHKVCILTISLIKINKIENFKILKHPFSFNIWHRPRTFSYMLRKKPKNLLSPRILKEQALHLTKRIYWEPSMETFP
ncbi:jasmonate-zim-domain 10 [Olea europaea subsp. europaea]|uniref:Jasmonate-zim-domain 10 n=1 Tax=Olea europaea subsp. europaea TaxID=158383 RepID=A0A8S0PSS6_OLEEU|nr:jasmonate-zim-domain 10 [Olea europaea subsp. europaea]